MAARCPHRISSLYPHAAALVYKDTKLIWAAKMDTIPVAMRVAKFGDLDGLIVCLDENGTISVLYLGTDPPTNAVTAADQKELDYEAMDAEHRELLNDIRLSQASQAVEPSDRINMRVQMPKSLDELDQDTFIDLGESVSDGKIVSSDSGQAVQIACKALSQLRRPRRCGRKKMLVSVLHGSRAGCEPKM